MGHVCTHDDYPGPNGNEHPVVAVIAIIAIIAAMLLIAWARLEVHGTGDIEAVLIEPVVETEAPAAPRLDQLKPDEEREVEAAVTSSRFATGFSP
jgi:hypothetical protein